MSETLILHNPGSRKGRTVFREFEEWLDSLPSLPKGEETRKVSIDSLGSYTDRPSRAIVVGGDGTVNAAVGFLLRNDLRIPLGIVPAGTGNNLFKGLGLSLRLEEAFRIALFGKQLRALDVVEIQAGDDAPPLFMIQTSALGFPATIAGQYDRIRKSSLLRRLVAPLGNSIYTLLSVVGLASQKIREWRGKELLEVRISMPGEELRETVLAIFVGNERTIGGGFIPCPHAGVDDGLMDLCFLRAGTKASYLKTLHAAGRGTHLSARETVVYRQTQGPLEMEISASIPLLVDGDLPVRSDWYQFTLLPKRVDVLVG